MASLKDLADRVKQGFLAQVPFTPQFNQNARQAVNLVGQVAKPFVDTYKQTAPSVVKVGNFTNPLTQTYNAMRGVKTPVPTFQDVTNTAKIGLTGAGTILAPGATAIAGGIGTVFNAGANLLNKRPILEGSAQAFGQGAQMGAMYSPLATFTNPLISKTLQKFIPGATGLAPRVGASVANVFQGIGMDKATGSPTTPLSVGIDAVSGFVGGKGQFGNAGVQTIKLPETDRRGIYAIADAIRRKTTRTADVKRDLDTYIDRYLGKGWVEQNGYNHKKAIKALMDIADKGYSRAYQTVWGLTDTPPTKGVIDRTQLTGKQLSVPNKNLSPTEYNPHPGKIETQDKLPQNTQTAGVPTQSTRPQASPDSSSRKIIANPMDDFEINVLGRKSKSKNIEPPLMKSDAQSVRAGTAKSELGLDEPKMKFADWVNARKATTVEGILQGNQFKNLDDKGIQGVFEFQAGKKSGQFEDVQNYFDSKYGLMQEEGINFNYKDDYLPQIWQNTKDEVDKVFRTLSKRPGFTVESLIKNYEEGIRAGLTPKFSKISDLVRSYEQATNKAVADHNFFKYLAEEGMILSPGKAPRDWISIDPDRFPKFSFKTPEGQYTGVYKAPPELAKMINNYLGDAKFEWLARAADWTSSVKNRVLSFGIPGTAINAHGFNILSRNVMASKNPIEGAITGIKYMLNSGSAEKYLDQNLAKAPNAVKNGLTLSANEFKNVLEEPQGLRGQFGDVWNKLFERGLFDRMLPALKLQKYEEVYQGFIKGGMNEKEAGRAAAKFTNDVFGGINWEELGKSRDMQNLLRTVILAPDWLQTNVRLAKNLPASVIKITDPKMAPYRKFLATFLGTYVTMNVVNKLTSGHWMWENDPGNAFNIEAGYTEDGQKRYIRPFGTGSDFARLPLDIFTALKKGDVSVIGRLVRNRLSIPLGVGVGMMFDTDYANQPIGWRGTDKYGNEMPVGQRVAGVGGEIATLLGMPAFAKQGIDYATGKTGAEQALLQGFELPVRYSGGTRSVVQKQGRDITGVTGKELYDQNTQLKGQTKFSDNQMEALRSGNIKIADILQNRSSNRAENEAKELVRANGEAQISGKKLFYLEDGEVKSLEIDREIPQLKTTGNEALDKKAKSKFSSAITAKSNDIYKMYELGLLTAEEAEAELDKLETLKKSGSRSKGVKVSMGKISVDTPKLTKTSRPKLQNIKIGKAPAVKMSKPKNISIKVGNYSVPAIKIKSFKNTLTEGQNRLA